jgi:hypothetical protein
MGRSPIGCRGRPWADLGGSDAWRSPQAVSALVATHFRSDVDLRAFELGFLLELLVQRAS